MDENETNEAAQAPTAPESQATPSADEHSRQVMQGLLDQAEGRAPQDPAAPSGEDVEQPEAPREPAPAGDAPSDEAIEAARTELNRHKIHKDIIDALTPDQLLAQAETLSAARAETNRGFNQLDALMKKMEALEARTAAGSNDSEAGGEQAAQPSEAPAGELDMSRALQPVDGDLYEGLPEALTLTAQVSAGYAEERIAAAVEPLVAELTDLRREVARRELAGQYPQLRDDGVFSKVVQQAQTLEPGVQADSSAARTAKALELAARMELGMAASPAPESPPQNGALVAPTSSGPPPAPKTSDEVSADYLRTRLGGGSPHEARRAAGL